MTELKAIEWQNAFRRTYKGNPMDGEANQACDMAIDALEKQIPKKPIKIQTSPKRFYYACPICENRQDRQEKHCYECGQALKWNQE